MSNHLVCKSLARCRERLEAAAEKHRPLAAMLVHQAELGNEPEPYWPENHENEAHHQLNLGGGPRCDIRPLLDANRQPAVGEKPYFDAEREPIAYSDGTPVAMYPGANRSYSLYGKMFHNSNEASYSEAVAEYLDSAAELGILLQDLPAEAGETLWQDWPHGFAKPKPTDLWTNAVFELAWQEHPASRLSAERWVWHKNHTLKYSDLPRWRTGGSTVLELFDELIERVGDPPAFWYSWIGNMWRASISAIDLLIPMLRQSPTEIAENPTSAILWKTYPLKSYREIYPDQITGTFSTDPHVLHQLGNPPPYPTYVPDENEIRFVREHFPQSNPADPPWKDIQAELIAAGLLDTLKELPVDVLLKVWVEKTKPPAATLPVEQPEVESDDGAGQKVTDTPPVSTNASSEANLATILAGCTDAPRKAYLSYKYAEHQNEKKLDVRPAYDWLIEHGYDDAEGLADYQLPAFDTWSRQDREVRSKLGEQKYQPRAGRATGGSVVNQNEI